MATKNGARLRVDKSGRIVVPKRLRDHLGIQAEAELEITAQSGGLFVRVVGEDPALVKVDGLWVHRGSVRPRADWEHVIEDIRDERIASILKG
jgi:AbrB family looped-hinge helix DNA binding protein